MLVLLLLSKILHGTYWPPFGLVGLWFYAAFAALVLGEFITEPIFTRPADALANAVALLVASVSVSLSVAQTDPGTARAGRFFFLAYGAAIVLMASFAIVMKDSSGRMKRSAEAATEVVQRFGSARWIFTLLLFGSAYAAFASDAYRVALVYLAWFGILVLRPFEALLALIGRRSQPRAALAGHVAGLEDPGVLLLQLNRGASVRLGSRARVGTAEGRIVDITSLAEAPLARLSLDKPTTVAVGAGVTVMTDDAGEELVGHVSEGTTLDELLITTSPNVSATGIREGRLLETSIRGLAALYQITGASVVESRVGHMSRDLIRIHARKLGVWRPQSGTFEPLPWLPDPGRPVSLVVETQPGEFIDDAIGRVPQTSYGVRFDLNRGVTHNTAILGILGVGKTHLAWELIGRLLPEAVKVVVLDITDRYALNFAGVCGLATQRAIETAINASASANLENTEVRGEQAGNIDDFVVEIRELVQRFMNAEDRLLILNPNRFNVSRMEGRPYAGHANFLVRLTMVEVTRIIAEAILRTVQEEADAEESENEDGPDVGTAVEVGQPHMEQEPDMARVCLVLEEAHSLIPEWNSVAHEGERMAVSGTARAVLQGRKYGYGCVIITQRTANVTKSILNQCNTVFGLRVFDATGMGFLENYAGPAHAKLLASLPNRHAVIAGTASSSSGPIVIELNNSNTFLSRFWEGRKEGIPPTDETHVIGDA